MWEGEFNFFSDADLADVLSEFNEAKANEEKTEADEETKASQERYEQIIRKHKEN